MMSFEVLRWLLWLGASFHGVWTVASQRISRHAPFIRRQEYIK